MWALWTMAPLDSQIFALEIGSCVETMYCTHWLYAVAKTETFFFWYRRMYRIIQDGGMEKSTSVLDRIFETVMYTLACYLLWYNRSTST
jgi:hypothetical protein